jgi:Tol biopolymer transport system component
VLPLSGDRKPIPIAATPAQEANPRFSPDGRWIAYESDESGRMEVYVSAFPPIGGKSQISFGGGSEPAWRGDGRELFFIAREGAGILEPARGLKPRNLLMTNQGWVVDTTIIGLELRCAVTPV